MTKLYSVPCVRVIDLTVEEGILANSGDRLQVEMTENPADGREALSQKKNIWGNEGIWK